MHGIFHVILKNYFIAIAGQEAWNQFLDEAKSMEGAFDAQTSYTSDETVSLLKTISDYLGLSLPSMLTALGEYYLEYHLRSEHGAMVRNLSDNFAGYINKLNDLHAMFKEQWSDMKPPNFRCRVSGEGAVTVLYHTYNQDLYPFATGLLNAICRKIFRLQVEINKAEVSSSPLGKYREHVTFNIVAQSDKPEDKLRLTGPDHGEPTPDSTLGLLTDEEWCEALPFHIFFDSSMTVIQMGNSIRKLCNIIGDVKVKVNEIFNLVEPPVPFEFKNVLRFINSSFVLEAKSLDKKELKMNPHRVLLAGKMVCDSDQQEVLFSGCPHSLNMDQLFASRLTISDLPQTNLSRELLQQGEEITEEQEISKRLLSKQHQHDQLRAQEQQLRAHSGDSQQKYDLLPPSIAQKLSQGQKVEPKKCKEVTLLMCDVPNFCEILPKVKPNIAAKVLNDIYSNCDALVDKYGVFKVRTLEEVYFVVAGAPDPMPDHAVRIGAMALEMMQAVKKVSSPVPKLPLHLRIGIHSGPVVGSLMGDKLPVYCLFGEAVNLTQCLKNKGITGRIHVSEYTVKHLKHNHFKVSERGDMMVRGDLMSTFFLYGYKDKVYPDLQGGENDLITVGTKAQGAANASYSDIQLQFLPSPRRPRHSLFGGCLSHKDS